MFLEDFFNVTYTLKLIIIFLITHEIIGNFLFNNSFYIVILLCKTTLKQKLLYSSNIFIWYKTLLSGYLGFVVSFTGALENKGDLQKILRSSDYAILWFNRYHFIRIHCINISMLKYDWYICTKPIFLLYKQWSLGACT